MTPQQRFDRWFYHVVSCALNIGLLAYIIVSYACAG